MTIRIYSQTYVKKDYNSKLRFGSAYFIELNFWCISLIK